MTNAGEHIRALKKERLPRLRAPSKRSSPCPMLKYDAVPDVKRRFFPSQGSIESLSNSVSDEEEWADDVPREELVFAGDFCTWPRVTPTESYIQSESIAVAKLDLNNNLNIYDDGPRNKEPMRKPKTISELTKGVLKKIFNRKRANEKPSSTVGCAHSKDDRCEIYCFGPVLEAAQNAYVYNDSKSFVDMKMKNNSDLILKDFEALQNSTSGHPSDSQVKKFVNEHFLPPGSEFETWTPDDWKENPSFLQHITDPELRSWAHDLNKLWKALGRKISRDVADNNGSYSMIYSSNPIIIPGGRFREFYYWDSYWVIRGLLLGEMYSTVKGTIRNFLDMVSTYGCVPNGGRLYYTKRSQPPFLTLMVREYVNKTGDTEFLREALPTLEQEYDFWKKSRSVTVRNKDGMYHELNRYASDVNQPRPESYREDSELIEGLGEAQSLELMSHITSACESGWDFSSRWTGSCYANGPKSILKDLRTKDIIPVDLNSILAAVEKTLAGFHTQLGNSAKATEFARAYENRTIAIEKILWNEDDGTYYDFTISQNQHNRQFFCSNVNPLWTKCYGPSVDVEGREKRILEYLKKASVLNYPGGVPTTLNESGEQWDFPNAWPPLMHMLIDGLATSSLPELQDEALKQAQKWITSNWRAYTETNAMFEKYDVTRPDGIPGGGGEYDVQTGFGWTNGVVLTLLDMYGDRLRTESPTPSSTAGLLETTTSKAPPIGAVRSLVLGAAAVGLGSAMQHSVSLF